MLCLISGLKGMLSAALVNDPSVVAVIGMYQQVLLDADLTDEISMVSKQKVIPVGIEALGEL